MADENCAHRLFHTKNLQIYIKLHKGEDSRAPPWTTLVLSMYIVPLSIWRLIMCSKKKILALESHDLSQTDTILIIVPSFPKLTHLRNDCLLNWANSQNDNYFHSKWSLDVILWICSALHSVISFSAQNRSRDSRARIFLLEHIEDL